MAWDARRLCFEGYQGSNFKGPRKGVCLYCGAPIPKRENLCEECTWVEDMEEIADCLCNEDYTKRLILLKELREHPKSRLSQALFCPIREYPEREVTRDPIFVLLRSAIYYGDITIIDGHFRKKGEQIVEIEAWEPDPKQDEPDIVRLDQTDDSGLYLTGVLEYDEDGHLVDEHRHYLTRQEILDAQFPNVFEYETCEMVFFTREEGEQYLASNKHHYPNGEGRIYCIPAKGQLAEILKKHTIYNKKPQPKDGG